MTALAGLGPLSNTEYACLHAFGVAALYVTDKLGIGAAADPRHARHAIVWLAWARSLGEAECVRDRVLSTAVRDHVLAVARACDETGIVLAPHADVMDRLHTRMTQVWGIVETAQRAGQLGWFNRAYREHRLQCGAAGGAVLSYSCALRRLKLLLLTQPDLGAISGTALRQLFATPSVTFARPLQQPGYADIIGTSAASGRSAKSHTRLGQGVGAVDAA